MRERERERERESICMSLFNSTMREHSTTRTYSAIRKHSAIRTQSVFRVKFRVTLYLQNTLKEIKYIMHSAQHTQHTLGARCSCTELFAVNVSERMNQTSPLPRWLEEEEEREREVHEEREDEEEEATRMQAVGGDMRLDEHPCMLNEGEQEDEEKKNEDEEESKKSGRADIDERSAHAQRG